MTTKQKEWETIFREAAKTKFLKHPMGEFKVYGITPHTYGFWINPLNGSSLRLSKSGYHWAVTGSELPYWRVNIKEQMLSKTFLKLERALTAPYYIDNLNSITLFGESDFIMLNLHDGDLETYLSNVIKDNEEE